MNSRIADQFPSLRCAMEYCCLSCGQRYGIDELLYTCPECGGVFLLENTEQHRLKERSGAQWRDTFDMRAATRNPALKGIFRFYELIAPVMEQEDILYLGDGNTPIVEASAALRDKVGARFAYKNDGQNPSASFKDRGMACAFSYLQTLIRTHGWDEVLTVCASTGDTSAAAALYASYIGGPVKSVVLLPRGKVTPQQLAQPLGNGATVLELPGVFDDCMKVVEFLAERYRVALLNSKNSWRILGQESYAYEAAQWYGWDLTDACFFIPVGNAGNITALMAGLLKLYDLGIITALPRIFGVQSHHADPVWRFYNEADAAKRVFNPVAVQPSVAQAAMIGNPVSFPRVRRLAERYTAIAGAEFFNVVQVTEQEIIDSMLLANRHGHIACTQGGECLAGLMAARAENRLPGDAFSILDATAHHLKFADFQTAYFNNTLDPAFGITPRPELINAPKAILSDAEKQALSPTDFTESAARSIADLLGLAGK